MPRHYKFAYNLTMPTKKPFLILASILLYIALALAPFILLKSDIKTPNVSQNSLPAVDNQNQVKGLKNNTHDAIAEEGVLVKRVVDGDTIELETGQKLRYIGINTPETVHPTKPVECFGHEAAAKNKELVEGKRVRLEKDVSETDKYGRLLRYVYLNNTFINDYLVRQGYAHASTFPPDVKYQDQFTQAEREARQNNMGLWSVCQSQASTPAQIQTITTQTGESGCNIKGNISTKGEKIYHMPGQKYYTKTVIDTTKGEKYFCTEEEARNSGFRKSTI